MAHDLHNKALGLLNRVPQQSFFFGGVMRKITNHSSVEVHAKHGIRFIAFVIVLTLSISLIPKDAWAWSWASFFSQFFQTSSQTTTTTTETATETEDTTPADTSQCEFTDASPDDPYTIKFDLADTSDPYKMTFFASHDFHCSNNNIERVVITMHGNSRTGMGYYNSMLSSANNADISFDKTMIIAPQIHVCNSSGCGTDGDARSIYWPDGSGWKKGHKSSSALSFRISSYAVIDRLLEHLSDANMFPNLTDIVVAGFSAGGQFTNRYAAGNLIDDDIYEAGIDLKYIVASPSSYLYLNSRRCNNADEEGCNSFGRYSRYKCYSYNKYHYGLSSKNSYMNATGNTKIRSNYPTRDVHYFIGDEDTGSSSLDTSCAAMAEGEQRYQRSMIYIDFMDKYYPNHVHAHTVIEGIGHSSSKLYGSEEAQCVLFDVNCE